MYELHCIVFVQALDGFMMMLSRDGRILYATDSISQFLGLRQVSLVTSKNYHSCILMFVILHETLTFCIRRLNGCSNRF